METTYKATIKTDSTVNGITENFKSVLHNIITHIKNNDYVLKHSDKEVSPEELSKLSLDLTDLTHGSRKKIAKCLWNFEKKKSLRAMNYLFHTLNKLEVFFETKLLFKTEKIDCKIRVDKSHREQEIIKAKIEYKKLRDEAEKARLMYKTIKGDFYKNKNI